jgi:hypothetical protein
MMPFDAPRALAAAVQGCPTPCAAGVLLELGVGLTYTSARVCAAGLPTLLFPLRNPIFGTQFACGHAFEHAGEKRWHFEQ